MRPGFSRSSGRCYPAPTLKEDDVAEPPNSRKSEKISSIRPKRERDSLVFSLSQEKDKYLIARSPACASHVSAKLELSFSLVKAPSRESSSLLTAVRSPTGLLYRRSRGLSRASGDAETANSKRNGHFTLSSVGGAQKSPFTNVAVFLNSRQAGSFLPTGTTRTTGSGMTRGRSRERDERAVWVL